MGQSASAKAAWRWARTWAAGRAEEVGDTSGGGHRPASAVRRWLWARRKRFQRRCQVRSLRWPSTARMAARRLPETARWRNVHRQPVVRRPLPHFDRILERILPHCRPRGECGGRREFGKAIAVVELPALGFLPCYPAWGFFSYPASTPRLYHREDNAIFLGASSEHESAAMVLPQRGGMGRPSSTPQTDPLSALSGRRHADWPRRFARLRRQ
jgi:hypothetical protein